MSPVALSGLLVFAHACADLKGLFLGKWHWLLYFLASSMYPRMLVTVDEVKTHHETLSYSVLKSPCAGYATGPAVSTRRHGSRYSRSSW